MPVNVNKITMFVCLSVCVLPIGSATGVVNYTYYIWIDAEFIGEGFCYVSGLIYTTVEKLRAKKYMLVCPKHANADHTTDVAN